MRELFNWLVFNWVELSGTLLGLAYLWFAVRQNIFAWVTGLLTSALYIYVFFASKFYADMGLQVYYVIISIYGWWNWKHGNIDEKNGDLQVSKTGKNLWFKLAVVNLMAYAVISFVLINYTDSPLPYWDAFTTSISIVATWMLAKKKIEHWLIWVVADAVSMGLYIYKGLYLTTILFFVYTIMAIWGYYKWSLDLKKENWQPEVQ